MKTLRDRTALALGALAVLQVLHLLDELRAYSADLGETVLRPQPILGIGGTLVAAVAVRRGAAIGRPLALVAASLITLGFVLSHGIPVESARTKPYWGDASADVVQWFGLILILATCATTVVLARRLPRWRTASVAPSHAAS
jgi:hypothetical protein